MKDGSESDSDSEAADNENYDINSDNESDVELEIASEVESDSEDALPQTNDIVRDKRIAEFFAPAPVDSSGPSITSFTQLKLSRPILKAIAMIGYSKPTEIQAKAIPLAMQGKDLCGAAVTGTLFGKAIKNRFW
jgi:ATP-dependent RNA helicase DDX27